MEAKKGDGIYSLLRRYDLGNDYCNILKFYEQNKLPKDAPLHTGSKYIIPVYIYNYDGKSIRSTIGIDDWKKAVRIKKYNESLKDRGLRKTNYADSKILWVPHHELYCYDAASKNQERITPSSSVKVSSAVKTKSLKSKSLKVPLFGNKHESFKLIDNSLKGQVFYVVSGHGGPDPGARCETCTEILCEDEYAYDISLRLAKNLMQRGAVVEVIVQDKSDGIRDAEILKCDYNEVTVHGKPIHKNQLIRLNQRASDINHLYNSYKKKGYKDQKAIIIHIDSNRPGLKQDAYFLHLKESKGGKKLASNMYKTFKAKYEEFQKDRGYNGSIRTKNFLMLRRTAPPAVYVELANIKNKFNQKRLTRVSNRQALADWMFEGLIK